MVGLGAVVVIHVILGWALASGLARKVVEVIKEPIETKIIEEVQPPPPPPPPENLPPPPPKALPPPPVYVPPPEIAVANPPPAPTITTTQEVPPPRPPGPVVPTAKPAPPAPAAPRGMKPAIADVRACSPTSEDYPAAARRAEATGITKIRFTVDAKGALAKAEVQRSSGSSREHKQLDRIAMSKLSDCRFTPGTDAEGRPVGGTFEVEYVWKID